MTDLYQRYYNWIIKQKRNLIYFYTREVEGEKARLEIIVQDTDIVLWRQGGRAGVWVYDLVHKLAGAMDDGNGEWVFEGRQPTREE